MPKALTLPSLPSPPRDGRIHLQSRRHIPPLPVMSDDNGSLAQVWIAASLFRVRLICVNVYALTPF